LLIFVKHKHFDLNQSKQHHHWRSTEDSAVSPWPSVPQDPGQVVVGCQGLWSFSIQLYPAVMLVGAVPGASTQSKLTKKHKEKEEEEEEEQQQQQQPPCIWAQHGLCNAE